MSVSLFTLCSPFTTFFIQSLLFLKKTKRIFSILSPSFIFGLFLTTLWFGNREGKDILGRGILYKVMETSENSVSKANSLVSVGD